MPGLKIGVVPVTPFQQNCTLISDVDTGQTAVVDPGGDADRIMAALKAAGLDAVAIWLTHGHLDHAGGVADLLALLNTRPDHAPVEVIGPDARDAFLLSEIESQAAAYGLKGLRNASADRFLTEGETVCLGAHVFDVLHCPGHTPGHVVFVNKSARFAQVGDVLFRGSVGRTDFPYGDHQALVESIRTKLLPLGDDLRFVCGHGPNSTIGAERASNPFIQ
jgi:glyoxylase-like metal-dependent hydrolase (beta-lactamase superfamily II)